MSQAPLKNLTGRLFNRVMIICRAPKVQPPLVNNMFILTCIKKAKHFFKTVHAYHY